MVICHLTSVHKRYDIRIFQKICSSLVNSHFDVFLIVADGIGNESINNVKIIDVGVDKGRLLRFFNTSKRIYKKALELNCDIYHFHDPELFPIALKLKRNVKKVIFDSHEYLPDQIMDKPYLPVILRKIISNLTLKYYDRNLLKLDAVIAVTPHIVQKLSRKSNNVHILTNYPIIDKHIANPTKEEYLNRENNLFYAGTIYDTSQQEIVLEALGSISNMRYLLIGSISSKYFKKLNKSNSWNRVDFNGYIDKNELDKIANKATIGLALFDYIPNLGYRTGSLGVNKFFEYMLYGLPIICTDFDLWRVIVDKYKCGLYIPPNNVQKLTDSIEFLIKNKEEAYEMGQNGRRAIIEEFNWGMQETNLFKIYNSILN